MSQQPDGVAGVIQAMYVYSGGTGTVCAHLSIEREHVTGKRCVEGRLARRLLALLGISCGKAMMELDEVMEPLSEAWNVVRRFQGTRFFAHLSAGRGTLLAAPS